MAGLEHAGIAAGPRGVARADDVEQLLHLRLVAHLCERGWAKQMVLSHDAACYNDWLPNDMIPIFTPNWHYLHISRDVVPALKQRGVTDEQVGQMLVDNPRRIFERPLGAY